MNNRENVRVMIDAWKVMVERMPGHHIEEAEGVATVFANDPLAFLNISVGEEPLADAAAFERMLEITAARARVCPHASMIGLCETWLPAGWDGLVAKAGLGVAMGLTGMAADSLLPARRTAPAMEFRRVDDLATAQALAEINAVAYGMPVELMGAVTNMNLWQPDSFGFVGFVEGEAVCTASGFPVNGTVYIALVATRPEVNGKGYAEAVVRHTIAESVRAMGFQRMTLHATAMGRPLYASMGFGQGSNIVILMRS